MIGNQHIDPEDLALFALQFLTPGQNQAILAHLEHCLECRQELAATQGDLALLAGTAELHSPPALAREHLLQAIAREPRPRSIANSQAAQQAQTAPPRSSTSTDLHSLARDRAPVFASRLAEDEPRLRPAPRLLSRVLPWSGWAVAAGLALLVTQALHERDGLRIEVASVNHQIAQVTTETSQARRLLETLNDPSAQRVTLTLSKEAAVPQAKATYVPSRAALVFTASNMAPLAPAKVYELWIIPAGGSAPLAAGSFQPDPAGNASLILPQLPQGVTAKAFGITVEDAGATPANPTMPIIMAGAAGL